MKTDFPELENAIASHDLELARDLLRPLLESHADNPRIWYFAAQAARNEAQRKHFLEQAVKLDPLFHQAANELHALNPVELPAVEIPKTPPYASMLRRFGAFAVDTFMVLLLYWFFISTFAAYIPDLRIQVLILLFGPVLLHWLYQGYYFQWRNGKTFGGKLFGLRVVQIKGKPLGFRDAFLRGVMGYFASGLLLGAGFFWQRFNPQHQAWHDIIAETIVIRD